MEINIGDKCVINKYKRHTGVILDAYLKKDNTWRLLIAHGRQDRLRTYIEKDLKDVELLKMSKL